MTETDDNQSYLLLFFGDEHPLFMLSRAMMATRILGKAIAGFRLLLKS